MAIPLLGELERLINEHGSAVILKERLALANDQYVALEKKVTTLQEENAKLAAQNDRLQLDNYKLKEEVGNLQKQLAPVHTLEQTEIDILKLLSELGELSSRVIAHRLNLHLTKAEYFIGVLSKQKYISGNYVMHTETTYELDSKGREYLVKNGLV